jgi:hypothetical protein
VVFENSTSAEPVYTTDFLTQAKDLAREIKGVVYIKKYVLAEYIDTGFDFRVENKGKDS